MAFYLQKFAQMPAHSKIKEWTFSKHATRLKDSQTSHIFKRKLIFKKMKMNDTLFEFNIRMRQHWTGNIQYWHHPTVQQRTVPGNKEPECPPTCRWRGTCPTPHHGRSWTHFSGGAEHSFPMKSFCFRRLEFYNIDVTVHQYSQYSKTASTSVISWLKCLKLGCLSKKS